MKIEVWNWRWKPPLARRIAARQNSTFWPWETIKIILLKTLFYVNSLSMQFFSANYRIKSKCLNNSCTVSPTIFDENFCLIKSLQTEIQITVVSLFASHLNNNQIRKAGGKEIDSTIHFYNCFPIFGSLVAAAMHSSRENKSISLISLSALCSKSKKIEDLLRCPQAKIVMDN